MNSSDIILQRLRTLKDIGRLPHALMLTGDDPEHLLTHAKNLIHYALCTNRSKEAFCGECPACKKFDRDVHTDFLLVAAEKKEIKIDQIRQAIHWLQLRPNESDEKFCVIFRAEDLNRSAANSFLKTLEEPPPHAKTILLSRTADHLLPTIRSRVQIFRFPSSTDAAQEAQSLRHEWMADLERVLASSCPSADLFNLTASIPNEREHLLPFFECTQRAVLNKMREYPDLSTPDFRKLEELYDLSVRLEGQLLRGYGNLGMALDRWLMKWTSTVERI